MATDSTTRDAQRAISGDTPALERLWDQHRRWAAAVVLAHMPRGVELEDLLQEIAMTMVRKIRDLQDPDSFRPWLRQIAVNAAKTAGRRKQTRQRVLGSPSAVHVEQLPSRPAPETGAISEARRLLELAQRLHPDYREPLLLRSVRGMSYRQISAVLELPVTTIETRIARARRMLREEVDFEKEASALRVVRRDGDERGAI